MLVLHSWTLEIKDKRLWGDNMAQSGLYARLCHAFLVSLNPGNLSGFFIPIHCYFYREGCETLCWGYYLSRHYVCLSVRLRISKNDNAELYRIFCAYVDCMWPWLGPRLQVALQWVRLSTSCFVMTSSFSVPYGEMIAQQPNTASISQLNFVQW